MKNLRFSRRIQELRNAFLDGTNAHATLLTEHEWIKIINEHIESEYKLIVY